MTKQLERPIELHLDSRRFQDTAHRIEAINRVFDTRSPTDELAFRAFYSEIPLSHECPDLDLRLVAKVKPSDLTEWTRGWTESDSARYDSSWALPLLAEMGAKVPKVAPVAYQLAHESCDLRQRHLVTYPEAGILAIEIDSTERETWNP